MIPYVSYFICRFLNEKCTQVLQRYYESKGHIKKQLTGGAAPLQELRRDLHGFIASKANINIEVATSYGGETFLVRRQIKILLIFALR